jgi:hypothetical protein
LDGPGSSVQIGWNVSADVESDDGLRGRLRAGEMHHRPITEIQQNPLEWAL